MRSGTTEPIAQIQSRLSEDLYFLKRMTPRRFYQRTYSPLTARLLDTVALFLATGPSNPSLATFWWEKDAKLYMTKSPCDHQNDATVAKIFFECLEQAQGLENMIPFLATYSQASVNKRICQLRQSLRMSLSVFFDLFDKSHENEDPLKHLKSIVLDSQPPFVFNGSENAMRIFRELLITCRKMLDVHALVFSTGHHDTCACLLQRHLDKMAQYLHVEVLIKFWKRRGRGIEIVWIPGIEAADAPHTFNMETILSRHLSIVSGQFYSSSEQLRSQVTRRFGLKPSITIIPHVHAEIALILHVSENLGLQRLKDSEELLIGSNKTSCFACTYWRKQFNSVFEVNWETTCNYSQYTFEATWQTMRINSKPRWHWAIPCSNSISSSSNIDPSLLCGCYEAVLAGVQDEVKVQLERELRRADNIIIEREVGF